MFSDFEGILSPEYQRQSRSRTARKGLRSATTLFRVALSQFLELTGDGRIHSVGRQIDPTGPGNRTIINEDLLKKLFIPEWR